MLCNCDGILNFVLNKEFVRASSFLAQNIFMKSRDTLTEHKQKINANILLHIMGTTGSDIAPPVLDVIAF